MKNLWRSPGVGKRHLPELSLSFASILVNQLGVFLTVKLAVSLVAPAQYGIFSLITGAVALSMNLVFQPMLTAKARDYFDQADARAYVSQTAKRILLYAALIAVAVYLWFPLIQHYPFFSYTAVSAAALFCMQPLFTGAVLFCEINRKYAASGIVNITARLFQVGCLLALLLLLGRNAGSIALAQALGYFAGIGLLFLPWLKIIRPENSAVPAAVSDGANFQSWLLLFGITGWILATSDRYLLQHFGNLADVGEYSINYGLWSIPFLAITAWMTTYFRPKIYLAAAERRWGQVRKLTYLSLTASASLTLACAVFLYFAGPLIALKILKGPYWSHIQELLLTISIGHIFFALAGSLTVMLLALRRVDLLVLATTVGAVISVAANWMWIPTLHVVAAGRVTLLSYCVWFVVMLPLSEFALRKVERPSNGTDAASGPGSSHQLEAARRSQTDRDFTAV